MKFIYSKFRKIIENRKSNASKSLFFTILCIKLKRVLMFDQQHTVGRWLKLFYTISSLSRNVFLNATVLLPSLCNCEQPNDIKAILKWLTGIKLTLHCFIRFICVISFTELLVFVFCFDGFIETVNYEIAIDISKWKYIYLLNAEVK